MTTFSLITSAYQRDHASACIDHTMHPQMHSTNDPYPHRRAAIASVGPQQPRRNTIVLTMDLAVEIYAQRPQSLIDDADSTLSSAAAATGGSGPDSPARRAQPWPGVPPANDHGGHGTAPSGGHDAQQGAADPPARCRPVTLTSASHEVAAKYGVSLNHGRREGASNRVNVRAREIVWERTRVHVCVCVLR
jgi:hypothetical protein